MTMIKKKKLTPEEKAAKIRKDNLARAAKMVTVTRENLAYEKHLPHPNSRDLDILQDLHEHAKELYAEMQAST